MLLPSSHENFRTDPLGICCILIKMCVCRIDQNICCRLYFMTDSVEELGVGESQYMHVN